MVSLIIMVYGKTLRVVSESYYFGVRMDEAKHIDRSIAYIFRVDLCSISGTQRQRYRISAERAKVANRESFLAFAQREAMDMGISLSQIDNHTIPFILANKAD